MLDHRSRSKDHGGGSSSKRDSPERGNEKRSSGSSKGKKQNAAMPAPPGVKISTGSKHTVKHNPYMEPDQNEPPSKSKGCVLM